eukprot:UN32262
MENWRRRIKLFTACIVLVLVCVCWLVINKMAHEQDIEEFPYALQLWWIQVFVSLGLGLFTFFTPYIFPIDGPNAIWYQLTYGCVSLT